MKVNKKTFAFTAKWLKTQVGGHLSMEDTFINPEDKYTYVAGTPEVCKIGAKLCKWLGKKNRKVKITVTK